MKLYATTTSERASKGQGGNKFLRINLTVGSESNRINAGTIELNYIKLDGLLNTHDGVELLYYAPEDKGGYKVIKDFIIPHIKGKKQKTANIWNTMDKEFPKGFIKSQ